MAQLRKAIPQQYVPTANRKTFVFPAERAHLAARRMLADGWNRLRFAYLPGPFVDGGGFFTEEWLDPDARHFIGVSAVPPEESLLGCDSN